MPSLSESSWSILGIAGQLSMASGIVSPSWSASPVHTQSASRISLAVNGSLSLQVSPGIVVIAGSRGSQSTSSRTPSSSSSSSQASPMPSPSRSSWSVFGSAGQLSMASGIVSPSWSASPIHTQSASITSLAVNGSLSLQVSPGIVVIAGSSGSQSSTSRMPSSSSSSSQASPIPSPSKSSWFILGIAGQLSMASGIVSPSWSGSPIQAQLASRISLAVNRSLSSQVSPGIVVIAGSSGSQSSTSNIPSSSSSSSQRSPMPSLSKSAWPGLAVAMQLSTASAISSPSWSGSPSHIQALFTISPTVSGSSSSQASNMLNVIEASSGPQSIPSDRPSSSSSLSQASPMPSPSKSSWLGLGSAGQLSTESAIPSPSWSGSPIQLQLASSTSLAVFPSLSLQLSPIAIVTVGSNGSQSILSGIPSLSSSLSQRSPMPSPSKSAWLLLPIVGQLSQSSGISSASLLTLSFPSGQISMASHTPSLSSSPAGSVTHIQLPPVPVTESIVHGSPSSQSLDVNVQVTVMV